MQKAKSTNPILAAAVATTLAGSALADINPTTVSGPVAYDVSVTGATALGALTRGANTNSNNNPTSEQNGLWRLGSSPLTIGRSTYTFGAVSPVQQYLGYRDVAVPISGENTVRDSDRIVYQYHEVGSINGILELVKSNGLFRVGGVPQPPQAPDTPSVSAPLWRMGWKQINATTYVVDGNGTQAATAGGYAAQAQPFARIAYSDVRSFQAFAVDGSSSSENRPRQSGYGLGSAAYNPQTGNTGTNFQQLANRTSITGETSDPNVSHLRNQTIAVVPFGLVANPGTGLSRVTETEGKWLQSAGRLPNGANFNSTTREIGSGTRNQGDNNMNLDASWGGGERDRRSLNPTPYNDVDANGQTVQVRLGDEVNPNKDLFGVDASLAASVQPREHRIGPLMRFSDKSSGGSGIRPVVVNNRMALGILSSGDIGDRGRIELNGTVPAVAKTDPMRVLKIKWDFQTGEAGDSAAGQYTQPTANDTTTGRYQMWSEAQGITVVGKDNDLNGTFESLDTVGNDTNPNKPIFEDTIDHSGSTGVHRKFLNNINNSLSTFGQSPTLITPADAVIAAGFVPPQIMKTTKEFDGGMQSVRTLSTVDPDGAGPGLSEADLFTALVTNDPPAGSQNLKSRLNWIDPSTDPVNFGTQGFNGDITNNLVTYKIFADDLSNTSTTPTKQIVVKNRTVLMGDFNGDAVRDLNDAASLAQAYARSSKNGAINGNTPVTNLFGTLSSDDLIVLGDANGSGNISGTNAAPVYNAVERNDVKFFLYGSMADTSTYTDDFGVLVTSPTIQQRREDGVRRGQLKKNLAIDTFNTRLDQLVGVIAGFTQAEADALKVDKLDVNMDGVRNRADAIIVDGNVGKNFTNLTDVLGSVDDLVAAELTDNNVITHVLGPADGTTSDFFLVRNALGSQLLSGDANIDGLVNLSDFNILTGNFGNSVTRWSQADFDFNGLVNLSDFNALASNFGLSAGPDGMVGPDDWAALSAAVPEPTAVSAVALGGLGLIRRRRRI